MNFLTKNAVGQPKRSMWAAGLFSLVMIILVAAPSLAPDTFSYLNPLKVDTDPENMLSADESVRVFHNQMKETFALHDMVVVGVINEVHSEGVFNTSTLSNIHELAEFAQTIRWKDDTGKVGLNRCTVRVGCRRPEHSLFQGPGWGS